jgi:acetyl esterase/lipase
MTTYCRSAVPGAAIQLRRFAAGIATIARCGLIAAALCAAEAAHAEDNNADPAPASTTCTYSLSATSANFTNTGSINGSVSVTASGSTCSWKVSTTATFASITSGTTHTGSGKVNYTLSSNTGVTETAVFTIAGLVYTATHEGAVEPPVVSSTVPAFTGIGPYTVGTLSNQTYGTATISPSGTVSLAMDFYYPEGVTTSNTLPALPTIVFIHMGGWSTGDKSDCFQFDYSTTTQTLNSLCKDMASHGYVVASINYRLSGQAIWPAQIEDINGAVRFIKENANSYATISGKKGFVIDTTRIGVFGPSAGGHLADMLATSVGTTAFEGNLNPGYTTNMQVVVAFFGPTDFTQMDAELEENYGAGNFTPHDTPTSDESLLLGCTLGTTTCDTTAETANPVNYVTASAPPFLLRHGSEDETVPYEQGQLLQTALEAVNVYVDYAEVVDKNIPQGVGHGFQNEICTAGEDSFNPDPNYHDLYRCSDFARAAYKNGVAFFDHVLRGL